MNRSMTMNGLAQPGSTLADDYGAVGSVVRMRPGGHIDPSQAYGAPPAPEPEPEPEPEVVEVSAMEMIDNDDGSEGEDLNGWLKDTFGKEARQGRQADRQDARAALKGPIRVPALGTDPQGYQYDLYPDHSVLVVSGPDSVGQMYPANSQVAQNVANAYGPHPAYKRAAGLQNLFDVGTDLLGKFIPSGQDKTPTTVVQKKDNTALYVGLGIASVAAIATLVYVVQRGK